MSDKHYYRYYFLSYVVDVKVSFIKKVRLLWTEHAMRSRNLLLRAAME